MTDIDFDELDKAVNSLMGDAAVKQPKEESTAAPSSSEPNETAPAGDASAEPKASVATSSATVDTPEKSARPAALAVKRRGQFMDVMHPSADMSNPRTPRAAASVSRHGVTLSPTAAAPAISSTPASEAEPTSTTQVTAPEAPVWPDPISFDNASAESEAESTPNTSTQEIAEPSTDTSAEPLSSPFLPDAKVEKRPLGASLPTGIPEAPITEPTPVAPAPTDTQLPDELSGGVLAVESNELPVEPEQLTVESNPPATAKPKPAPIVTPAVESDTAEPTEPTESTGPASIPPQYKAQDTKAEPAEHSALYDEVSAAHTATPQKKKSGWLVPVAIVLLIILGCAGGVAAYYMMLG